jgi:hypothetical protein
MLYRNTLGSQDEETIIEDKFLTLSALYIRRKLQKLVTERSRDLDYMVQWPCSITKTWKRRKRRISNRGC